MRPRSQWTLIVAVVAMLLCMTVWSNRAQSTNRILWEYKILETYGPSAMNPAPNVNSLNELGREGWELLAIRSGEFPNKESGQIKTEYYLKRQK